MTICIMQRDPGKVSWFRQVDLYTVPLGVPLPEVGDHYDGHDDYSYPVLKRQFSYHGTRHNDDGEIWNLACTWVTLTIDGPYEED